MGGILGGLLFVIDRAGGLFLFLLVGSNAWRDTENGALLRTCFGGAILGLLVGIGLNLFILSKPSDKDFSYSEVVLVISVSGGIVLAFCLYVIYRLLGETEEGPPEEGPTQE